MYPGGKLFLVLHFVRCAAQDIYNLGSLCLPSLMALLIICCQTTYKIELRCDRLMDLGPERLSLHWMLSGQGRSMIVIAVTT